MGNVALNLVQPLTEWFGQSTNEPTENQHDTLERIFSEYSDNQLTIAANWTVENWELRNRFPPPAFIKHGLKGTKKGTFGNIKITKGRKEWQAWKDFYDLALQSSFIHRKTYDEFYDKTHVTVPTAKPPKHWKTYQGWLDLQKKDKE